MQVAGGRESLDGGVGGRGGRASPAAAPARACSAAAARIAVGATPVRASAARRIRPPSSATSAATATMAKLAWIRAYSVNACPPSQAGSRTSVRISSGSSAVVNGPCRNSAAGMRRVPPGPVATSSAPSASATAGSSAAGSAWARLPPIVPLLRMGVCATYPTASATSGAAIATSGERSSSARRVIAPTTRTSPSRRMPLKPATLRRSMR